MVLQLPSALVPLPFHTMVSARAGAACGEPSWLEAAALGAGTILTAIAAIRKATPSKYETLPSVRIHEERVRVFILVSFQESWMNGWI
jgi:hypothetical protein